MKFTRPPPKSASPWLIRLRIAPTISATFLDGLSGLAEIARRLDPIAEIAVVRLGEGDIVRHPLVGDMLSVL